MMREVRDHKVAKVVVEVVKVVVEEAVFVMQEIN